MLENKIPEKILEVIRDSGHCVLATHVQPDGDAVGSLLALAEILKDMGKNVFAFLDEPISHLYDFLPGCNKLNADVDKLQQFIAAAGTDLCAIALDCGEADRIGKYRAIFEKVSPFLVIDHHLSHCNFGDYRWIDPHRSSTGEMLYEICEALGQTPSYTAAYALYVAICTDTGSFRYECTGARTFEIAGKLVDHGVKPNQVAGLIYENFSPERLQLMQMVLKTLDLCENGQIACIHVTREMFEISGALTQDVEGFVEYPRSISSVKVAVFFKETRANMISVSLRAKGECNVASIAKQFGGGGHRNAAGCKFPAETIDSVGEKVLTAIKASLNAPASANDC